MLKQAGDVSGTVIVSCSLPMNADNTDLVIRDVGFDPVDAGRLRIARSIEPFALLVRLSALEHKRTYVLAAIMCACSLVTGIPRRQRL